MTAEIVPLPSGPNDSPKLDLFEEFWAACPRKEGYVPARTEWRIAVEDLGIDPNVLIAAAKAWARAMAESGRPRDYTRRPATWLKEWGWKDSYEMPKAPVASPHEQEQARLQDLADKWWPRGVTATRFVRDHRRDHISDADKRAIVAAGIRIAEEIET